MTSQLSPPRRTSWFYRAMMGFIGLFDRWLHLSCRAFVHLSSDRHERPLTTVERARHRVHRAMCKICRVQEDRMDNLRLLTAEIGKISEDEADLGLSPDAKARIRSAMADASRSDTPS